MAPGIRIATVAAVVLCCLTLVSAAAEVSGKWSATFDTQLGEQRYTGKIVSDDQIDFERKIADIATEKLVAKRVK